MLPKIRLNHSLQGCLGRFPDLCWTLSCIHALRTLVSCVLQNSGVRFVERLVQVDSKQVGTQMQALYKALIRTVSIYEVYPSLSTSSLLA